MQTIVLHNRWLTVTIAPETLACSVERPASGLTWAFQPNQEADLRVVHATTESLGFLKDARTKSVQRFATPDEERAIFLLEGLPGGVGLSITYTLPRQDDLLRIEVEPLPTTSLSRIAEVWYPGPLSPADDDVSYTVWPNAGGMILPAQHDQEIHSAMSAYESQVKGLPYSMAYSWFLYMPWWGGVGKKGAYLAIAETPFDFGLDLHHPRGGPTTTRPVWAPSMGELAYPRAIRYIFREDVSYVDLAKIYRDYAQEIGRWLSLEDKLARNPLVQELIGTVIFPLSICTHNVQHSPTLHRVTTFAQRRSQVERLRALGRRRAYLHVDGWGFRGYDNQHPDFLPPNPEAGGWEGLIALAQTAQESGYLFGLHDQYRDFYLDSPAFNEEYAVHDPDGSLPGWSRWAGGEQAVLCAKRVLPFLRHNYARLRAKGVHLNATYLDVFSMNPLDECYHPAHATTREECFHWRVLAFESMRRLGMVVSSEEPSDCFVPTLDFVHWNAYPRDAQGAYLGIPVPLHDLVYHDALLTPAHYDYGHGQERSGQDFLEGMARVQIPYGQIEWESSDQFRQVDAMAELHAAWATDELVDHRLLDADGMIVQEYIYAQGAITVDLAALRYRIQNGPLATDGWRSVDR